MAASYAIEVELAGVGGGWTVLADRTSEALRILRGFQTGMPDDLLAAPTSLSFSLDNSSTNSAAKQGYYSPDNANLRSGWATGIRVRIRATVSATTTTRFIGWIEDIVPAASKFGELTCGVTAFGWIQEAARAPITGLSLQTNKRGDQLMTTLVGLVSNAPAATSYATTIDVYPFAFDDLDPANSVVADAMISTLRSGLDRCWEKADGTIVVESRQTRETLTTPVLTITDTGSIGQPGLAITALPAKRTRASILNTIEVTAYPRRVDASPVVIWALPVSGSVGGNAITPGIPIVLKAPYVDPNNLGSQIGAYNTLIDDGHGGSTIGASGNLPAADFQFMSAPNGAGSDVSANVTCAVVFGAVQATITITTTVTAYYNKLQCRGQGVYAYQTVVGSAVVSGSVTNKGTNKLAVDCRYQADPFFAQNAAKYLASVAATDATILTDGVRASCPATDETTLTSLLAIEISKVIAVTEQVVGITAGSYWVNAITEEIDERDNVTMTFGLMPNLSSTVWTLGIAGASELGVTTVLGF